jgi:hypothetical protein
MIGLEDEVSSSLSHSIALPFAVWSRYIGSVFRSPIHCTTLLPISHPRLLKARHALPLHSPPAHHFPSCPRRTFRLYASKTLYKPSLRFKLPLHSSKPKHFHWYSIVVTHPSFRSPWPSGFHRCLDTFHLRDMYTFSLLPFGDQYLFLHTQLLCLCNFPYPHSLHRRLRSGTLTFLLCLQKGGYSV